MRVLLLGEFSAVHRYLKNGLQELGNTEVKLYANGDSWKLIGGADGKLFTANTNRIKKIYNQLIEPYGISREFKGYDVVQFIHTRIYPLLSNALIAKKIAENNECISLLAVGGDYALTEAYLDGKFAYYAYDFEKKVVNAYDAKTLHGKMNIYSDKQVVRQADIIIPGSYEYTLGYEKNVKRYDVIPFPVDIKENVYEENVVRDKVVFFHGINKELEKGTPFIRKALERLQKEYPEEVEVVIDGHMPFARYIEVMKKANVVIDQCCAYGYGMNACIAMAQGKVVMSGNSIEARTCLGVGDIPIFHIKPEVNQIYEQLVYIVENKCKIPEWGYNSRKHIENYHDCIKIAQKYVDAWHSTGKI